MDFENSKQTPLVSIIVPAYNACQTIEECVNAILSSDYCRIELIIVDDGSTDSTPSILKRFENIKLFQQSNNGSAAAKNFGAKSAKGKYLYFLDSDVIIFQDTISKFVECALQYDVDLVVGRYSTHPMNDHIVAHYKALVDYVYYIPKKFRAEVKMDHMMGGGGDFILKKSFIKLDGFDDTHKGACVEREEFYLRLFKAGYQTAANPMIKTRHYFPSFFELLQIYPKRIFETAKLLKGPKVNLSYISIEKGVVAPIFSFLSAVTFLVAVTFSFNFNIFSLCGILFLWFSRDFIIEALVRKGLPKFPPLFVLHFIFCNVIFISGLGSVFFTTIFPQRKNKEIL